MLTEAQRAALTARVRRGRAADPAGRLTRRPAGQADPPASYGQEQLWFLDRFAPGRSTYNLPCPVAISGPLDTAALIRALGALIARHEVLRTRLVAGEDSHPVQVIDPAGSGSGRVDVTRLDYTGHDRAEARRRLRELAAGELRSPFELSTGPLLRACLVRLADRDHVLLLTVHHAVFDGWSAGVLVGDLAALYGVEAGGGPAGLDELPVQFGDYAAWERQRLAGPAGEELAAWWRQALAGAETLRLATDRTRPPVTDFDGREERRSLPPGLLDGLRELSRREGATLFATLMAGLQAVLHRYSGQDDLVVGTTSANRRQPALTPLIGFLVNTLPVRADARGDPPFTEFLGRVRTAMVSAFEHQDLPFARIVAEAGVARDASRAPLVQVTFDLVENEEEPSCAGGVAFGPGGQLARASESKFDLSVFARTGGGQLTLAAIYASALFDAGTIERLLGHLEVLLAGLVADPSARLSQLPLLTPAERHRELVEWNDTAGQVPAVCAHEGFAAQVARTPDAVAAEYQGTLLSYADLNQQANQIARRLRELGVGPEVLVGVCMRTGLTRLAALLGIWKAGGGYVPLDPALPRDRLSFMITDAGMPVILTDPASASSLPAGSLPSPATRDPLVVEPLVPPERYQWFNHEPAELVDLESEREQIAALDGSDLESTASPENVAYVIYTSGSTGQPKGVVVEHRHLVNQLHAMIRQWDIGPGDAVLQFASLSFDSSVPDMFMPLLAGARVVLAPAQTLHSPPRLTALMRDRAVTFACLTPSVISLLGRASFPALRVLMSAGEELPSELARRWAARPALRFVNDYGPTETTVNATFMELDPATALPPPIGRPYWPNYRAYVLDRQLSPVPAGVTGELYIGGAGVARGYLNRPELTRERFIPDPFSGEPGARLYKTGDLVRRRPDGAITFAGRIDGQVKIRGLRIELGEIEAALMTHPGVTQAVAAVRTDPAGDKQLAAWYRSEPGASPEPAALRAHLARTLPGYMVPAELTPVTSIPLSNSGKADRAALLAARPAEPGRPAASPATTPPATFTEMVLADSYAAVLGRGPVGALDSFFDLGGSSLQVMRLVDAIHAELGADVGVTEVFLHPTPRQLAASIDTRLSGGDTAGSGPLVRLSRGPGERPLFLVHAVGGTVVSYAPLARELAGTFAVTGVEAPGLHRAAIPASLAALTDEYTGLIRAAQPDGPYRLAGWSMGGVIAFEITRRLERTGAEVSLLALLDAPFAAPGETAMGEDEPAAQFVADAARSLGWEATAAPGTTDQLGWLAARLAPGDGQEAMLSRLRTRLEVFQAHVRMLSGYQPAGPPVRAPALIVSAQGSPNSPAARRWPAVLSGPVTALPVPGDHYEFLRPPLVAEVATTMEKLNGDQA
jgi:amino acid adenylation domain-containing protein